MQIRKKKIRIPNEREKGNEMKEKSRKERKERNTDETKEGKRK
jgi:hypothetical protein